MKKYILFLWPLCLLILCSCQTFPATEESAILKRIEAALEETPQNGETLTHLYDELGHAMAALHQSPGYTWTEGHLDNSAQPYLALSIERNHEDLTDSGTLYIYGIQRGVYRILAELPLQYDNGTYAMAMGKVSDNTYGILLHNYVGNHSGYTYAYGWDGQKLFPLITDQRLNLFSATTDNIIATDDDNVLYWSQTAYRQDSFAQYNPQRDTMEIFLAWNGQDNARIVGVDRGEVQPRMNEPIYLECERRLTDNPEAFLPYYSENITKMNHTDATSLLTRYIELLSLQLDPISKKLHQVMADTSASSLQASRINERNYLDDLSLWPGNASLRRFLLEHYDLGYYVNTAVTPWIYDINYPLLQEKYGLYVLSELDDYMTIRSYELTDPCLRPDQTFAISQKSLAQRLMITDNFITSYPYSPLLDYIRLRNEYYARLYFFGSAADPHYDPQTLRYDDNIIVGFYEFAETHPQSYLANNIYLFLEELSHKNFRVNDHLYHLIDEQYGTTS